MPKVVFKVVVTKKNQSKEKILPKWPEYKTNSSGVRSPRILSKQELVPCGIAFPQVFTPHAGPHLPAKKSKNSSRSGSNLRVRLSVNGSAIGCETPVEPANVDET